MGRNLYSNCSAGRRGRQFFDPSINYISCSQIYLRCRLPSVFYYPNYFSHFNVFNPYYFLRMMPMFRIRLIHQFARNSLSKADCTIIRFYSAGKVSNEQIKIANKSKPHEHIRFEAPEFFELDGLRIPADAQIWNLSKKVEILLQRRLLEEKGNPLNLLKQKIIGHFNSDHRKPRGSSPLFTICENEPRLVDVFENFDSLLIPKDHPSRRISDTYYVNENYCLRAHTSAHQFNLIQQGLDNFLVIGDVYRRDEIDKTHFPCFHQIEGVRIYAPHELFGEKAPEFFEENPTERSPEKQELHTQETAKLLEAKLKNTLESLCRVIFGNEVEMRWVSTYFPFTYPSFELEVFFEGKWLEVLGCGIMEQKLLESAGAGTKVGWAFGLGLERLAMVLYGIPDIRLFWSNDSGFLSQFAQLSPNEIVKYKEISKQPQLKMDLSFWLPKEDTKIDTELLRADVYDVIRMIGGDLIEQTKLFDEYENKKMGRRSQTYRIIYRSMERPLTKNEVNIVHKQIETHLAQKFGIEIR